MKTANFASGKFISSSLTENSGQKLLRKNMLYIFGCGLYTLYCHEWMQFLILLAAEFGCFVLVFAGTAIVEAAERFSGWLAGLGGTNE